MSSVELRSRMTCPAPGCGKPAYNGKDGKYCGNSCRRTSVSKGKEGEKEGGSVCQTPGCGKPAWNGKPGEHCGKTCKLKHEELNANKSESKERIELLTAGSEEYVSVCEQFYKKWQPGTWSSDCGPNKYPVPAIKNIYKMNNQKSTEEYYYRKKQKSMFFAKRMPGAGKGNEVRRFHGTRLACNFNGIPCSGETCNACLIMKSNRFKLDKSGDSSGTATYGNGLYFTAMSHTAKGYGIDSSLKRAPGSMTDFVTEAANNVVLLVLCLAGSPEEVTSVPYVVGEAPKGMDPPDPDIYHSRLVKKGNDNDELVIFNEAQAIPRFVVTFSGPAGTCDPQDFVKNPDVLCLRDGCGKRVYRDGCGKPGEYCSKGCKESAPPPPNSFLRRFHGLPRRFVFHMTSSVFAISERLGEMLGRFLI